MRQYGLELATSLSTTSLFRLPLCFFFYNDRPRMKRAVRREVHCIVARILRIVFNKACKFAAYENPQRAFTRPFDLDYHFVFCIFCQYLSVLFFCQPRGPPLKIRAAISSLCLCIHIAMYSFAICFALLRSCRSVYVKF